MPAFHIHALVGVGIGLASQGSICPQAGYPVALWTHIPLDDLNTDPETTWYHGYGEGWQRVAYIAFTALCTLAVLGFCIWKALWLLPYVVCACLPDFEHPIRLLVGNKDYWIHRDDVMFWSPLRRAPWGMLAYAIVAVLMMALAFRRNWL